MGNTTTADLERALAAALTAPTTRTVLVCDHCGEIVDPRDEPGPLGDCPAHGARLVAVELLRTLRPQLAPADVTAAHVAIVRAACLDGGEVAMTATRREVLAACARMDRAVTAKVYNALVRSGATS